VRLRVIELRQYTLYGGRRDELMRLFRHEFIVPQAAVGATVLATFRDLDDPDRFVWWRGFADMDSRLQALGAFYGGEVWAKHRAAANATMVDSDNVLLLESLDSRPDLTPRTAGVLRVAIHSLNEVATALFTEFLDAFYARLVRACGGAVSARFASEAAPNNFPKLPVRAAKVFVWCAHFADLETERAFSTRLHAASGWRDTAKEAVLPALVSKPEVLRLVV
jgi:hypothetical protein